MHTKYKYTVGPYTDIHVLGFVDEFEVVVFLYPLSELQPCVRWGDYSNTSLSTSEMRERLAESVPRLYINERNNFTEQQWVSLLALLRGFHPDPSKLHIHEDQLKLLEEHTT